MAAGMASESVEQGDKVTLRVIVDKGRNQVVYAEAGKDFVDVLFSFLTLPLGTIARLVAKESNIEAVRFGSISSIYESVSDLDQQHLWSHNCKEMLLNPRNSMEDHYKHLKLNIDDTPLQLFMCEDKSCRSCVSIFSNQKCHCGKLLKTDVHLIYQKGFVKESATFIIQDDLNVMPNDLGTSLCLLQKRGINNIADIEKKMILVGKKEVADLLKLSLLSKTPLSDFVLKRKPILCNLNQNFEPKIKIENGLPSSDSDEGKQMVVKVIRRTSNGKILFATAEEDFADILFSFLTFPLGAVLQMLEGFSSISCMDCLYRSIKELSPDRCLRSQELKDKLIKPDIFPNFELRRQILAIETFELTWNSQRLDFIDPKSPISGGYAKGPLTIMVTDDLIVTPMSSIDAISYLERMNVPLNDIEEIVLNIGKNEGLSILKASLTSTSVLTNSLNQYIG
ncbi:uncharacterized protein LOC123888431 [Trifolium pratense]|uniref:uncharacterized protein LOC123888431 n=1 Tax=Trifolium pratense TaxID=57577 RepID=UPI001E694CB9|nr:uncharacterized protein LOC123888431 [Trifolium pratense]